jgi:hypothetical protein
VVIINRSTHCCPRSKLLSVKRCKLKLLARTTIAPKVEENLVSRKLKTSELENVKTHQMRGN